MNSHWKTTELTDKRRILAFLQLDRRYAAYAIGDLQDVMFEQSAWAGAERGGQLRALVLHFRGLTIPALFLMGENDGLRAILQQSLRPERVFFMCRTEHLTTTQEFYTWEGTNPMWRMVLQPRRFQPLEGECIQLGPAHYTELLQLYTGGGGDAFNLMQLEHGVFFGVAVHDQLVAVAGTHLVSPTYGVAALGNVFTHPDCRGRGYGTLTTAAVVAELLRLGIPDIVLNVSQANSAAIRIYERLGFERYCPFLEGAAWVKTSTNPSKKA
jgi:ribosomal protein S18 acetylase RimI-like enzyme